MVPVNPTSSPSQVAPFFLAGFVYTLGSVALFFHHVCTQHMQQSHTNRHILGGEVGTTGSW